MGEVDAIRWPDLELAARSIVEGDGHGVKVAIIDSGVDVTHPALNGLELKDDIAVSCDGVNLRIEEKPGHDVYGHGTAVTSLLLKEAPGIEIGSFRALDSRNHARSFVISECVPIFPASSVFVESIAVLRSSFLSLGKWSPFLLEASGWRCPGWMERRKSRRAVVMPLRSLPVKSQSCSLLFRRWSHPL